jgi:Peptidase family M23
MRSISFVAALVGCLLLAPVADARAGWRWPVDGRVITPYRNGDDPYAGGQHRGIDIAAPVGARVVAASGGVVTFAGVAGSSGLTAAIRTDDGRFDTAYLHLSSIAVRRGDHLAEGEVLGAVGTSGRRSAAEPHLHFGVREAGSRFAYRDPLDLLPVAPPAQAPPRAVRIPVAVPAPRRALPTAPRITRVPQPLPLPVPSPAPLPVPAIGANLLETPEPTRHIAATRAPFKARGSNAPSPATFPTPNATARASDLQKAPLPPRRRHTTSPSHHAPAPHPAAGPRAHMVPEPAALAMAPVRPRPAHVRPSGLDVGWLVACVAMVAAATLLARPSAGTRSLRRAFQPEVSRQ